MGAEPSGKVCVVTGAAGNLGQAAAHRFTDAGATVALVDRKVDRLSAIFPEWTSSSRHLFVGGVDLTDEPSVRGAMERVFGRYGRLDVLFNAVGGYRGGKPVHEEDLATWDLMLTLNLRTVLSGCRAAIPFLSRGGGGRIVNTAAREAFAGAADYAAYGASKAAVVRLSESLARELRHRNVTVNCVVPGIIDTPQNRAALPDADFDTWVEPEAIADVIVFLASDAARRVTGAAIPVLGKG
jgi:NAD(P)-dependent dehydrogenase (short-subunit alcohol dehydrogenase family)